jgi:hypothetical protein
MANEHEHIELSTLLDGLKIDSADYFERAEGALEGVEIEERVPWWPDEPDKADRDRYWVKLPAQIRDEAKRLNNRLVSLMGQVARAIRNAPLSSEADQRDVMTGTKAMRAALLLRRFRSWDTEILNDEDTVLGVKPAGQSDNEGISPPEAGQIFVNWIEKISAIVDLVAASHDLAPAAEQQREEPIRYRPGTAFVMMWMDKSQPQLVDVSDAVKEVFGSFDVHAVKADDIEHEGLITSRILSEIKTAEFCFADLTGSRPNVYYEVGYAHALPRRVILFRKAGTGLHFDLAGYNCPEYENLHDLKEKLTHRLRALTNKEPKKPA